MARSTCSLFAQDLLKRLRVGGRWPLESAHTFGDHIVQILEVRTRVRWGGGRQRWRARRRSVAGEHLYQRLQDVNRTVTRNFRREGLTSSAMSLRVALAAEEAAGVQVLRLLVARGHEVATVLTSGVGGPGATVGGVASRLGLAVRPAALVREPALAPDLRDVDLLLNVHSLCVADAEVIAAPRLGAFNLHPGPLPEYAGLHVVNWAIYEGEHVHGVTLHRMVPDVDAGAIAFEARFPIAPDDTGLAVSMRCVRLGVSLVERLLTVAERGEPIPAIPQDLAHRRWFRAGPPDRGRLHWDRPAKRVANLVRAADYRPLHSPWGAPMCHANGLEIEVLAAHAAEGEAARGIPGTVGERNGERVRVAAADDWVWVERVRAGGRELDAGSVLATGQRLCP